MKIALVSTLIHPDHSFLTWLDYHRPLVDHIFLFCDFHPEFLVPVLPRGEGIHYFPGSQSKVFDSPINNNMVRQNENIQTALSFCLDMGIDWLIHFDIDEILYTTRSELETLFEDPDVGQVTFTNHEALPLWESDNPFHDCQYFKLNGQEHRWDSVLYPWFFMAYGNGKSAARVNPKLSTPGPHSFTNYEGDHLKGLETPFLLHYPNITYSRWLQKYENLGTFGDYWYDDPNHPNTLTFYMASRDVFQRCKARGDFSEAEAFFKSLILSPEEQERMIQAGSVMKLNPLESPLL